MILILITLFLKFDRLIAVLGGVTPFLVAVVVMIAVYYFITGDLNFSDVSQYSNQNKSIRLVGGLTQLIMLAYKLLLHLAFNCNGR